MNAAHSRPSTASLSPAEANALRRVSNGLAKHLPDQHREVLLSMNLVAITLGGNIVLTEAGRQRLSLEHPDRDDSQRDKHRS